MRVPCARRVRACESRIVAHRPDRVDRVLQHGGIVERSVLDGVEHERGGAELEERLQFAPVGIADDDVQSAVLSQASAWGSSRVLMIGRFRVVSSPTSSSKKSARWVIWKSTDGRPFSLPTFPEPVKICRVTKNAVSWCTMSPNGIIREMR